MAGTALNVAVKVVGAGFRQRHRSRLAVREFDAQVRNFQAVRAVSVLQRDLQRVADMSLDVVRRELEALRFNRDFLRLAACSRSGCRRRTRRRGRRAARRIVIVFASACAQRHNSGDRYDGQEQIRFFLHCESPRSLKMKIATKSY